MTSAENEFLARLPRDMAPDLQLQMLRDMIGLSRCEYERDPGGEWVRVPPAKWLPRELAHHLRPYP